MYWRKSTIGIDNIKLPDPQITMDLYLSTDDYAPFIKYASDNFGPEPYPWCVMRPYGVKRYNELVDRFLNFYEAYNFLRDLIEKDTGS